MGTIYGINAQTTLCLPTPLLASAPLGSHPRSSLVRSPVLFPVGLASLILCLPVLPPSGPTIGAWEVEYPHSCSLPAGVADLGQGWGWPGRTWNWLCFSQKGTSVTCLGTLPTSCDQTVTGVSMDSDSCSLGSYMKGECPRSGVTSVGHVGVQEQCVNS